MAATINIIFAFSFAFFLAGFTKCEPLKVRRAIEEKFYQYAVNYKRPYLTNATEFARRCAVFEANIATAEKLNQPYLKLNMTAVYGINKFSDLTPKEFEAAYLSGFQLHSYQNVTELLKIPRLIKSRNERQSQKKDWKNVLTAIKDQKSCGACWAFSVAETIESMYAIQHNTTPPSLSVQQLIDCDAKNNGCEGGDICEAVTWAQNEGVVYESKYPLTDQTDSCKVLAETVPRVWVRDSNCTSYIGNEQEMLNMLAGQGPVAVAVDASTWHNYVGGIIQFHCPSHINHAVQLVGFDLTGDVPFYIVRNSWGKDFGEQGFLRIKYGDNLCGVASRVASLKVKL